MSQNTNLVHQAVLEGNPSGLLALASELFQRDPQCSDFRAVAPVMLTGVCAAANTTGMAVYLASASGGTMTFAQADPADPTKMPAVGIIEYKQSSTSCVVRPFSQLGEYTASGLTAGTMYVVGSDGLLAKFGGSNYPAAGSVIQNVGLAISTTVLLMLPGFGAQSSAGGELDYVNVAAGTVLTNSTVKTTLLSYTIPANTLRAGSKIEIDFAGLIVAANGADEFLPELFIGASAVNMLAHAALNSTTNDIFTGFAKVAVRSTTSAFPVGQSIHGPPASATWLPMPHVAQVIDATAAVVVALKGTWNAANAGNQARGAILRVRVKR